MKLFFRVSLTIALVCTQFNFMDSKKVVVTGAGGKTGKLVLSKLSKLPNYQVVGLVRSQSSLKKFPKSDKIQNIIADITNVDSLKNAFEGAEAVIMCTSAVPQINYFSLIKSLVGKVFGKTIRPEFTFSKNGDPYFVDWLGAKNQIDAAKAAGVKQFVFLSSMGGTQPDNFLNTIGKVEGDEKSGNILVWKRKAEEYLIKSGLKYTIVHPGGLLDQPGGQREIVFGINDDLLKLSSRSIPRDDVAEVCVRALENNKAAKRSFDIISKPPGEGTVTTDWAKFFSQSGNSKY